MIAFLRSFLIFIFLFSESYSYFEQIQAQTKKSGMVIAPVLFYIVWPARLRKSLQNQLNRKIASIDGGYPDHQALILYPPYGPPQQFQQRRSNTEVRWTQPTLPPLRRADPSRR